MLNSFPIQSGINPDLQLASFLDCVDEYSIEAVEESCLRYRKGEVVGHDARYAPSTAQFTQTVKERQSYIDMRNAPRLPAPEAQKDSSPRVSGEKLQALTDVLHGRKSWAWLGEKFGKQA